MAIIRFVDAVKNAVLLPIKTAIDAGSGPGTIKFYTGTQPTLPSDAVVAQVLLGTVTFQDPSGPNPTSGAFTAATPLVQDSAADATGVATWARIADSTGATVCDVNVTATGGGGTIQLNTTSIVIGGPIIISSFAITIS